MKATSLLLVSLALVVVSACKKAGSDEPTTSSSVGGSGQRASGAAATSVAPHPHPQPPPSAPTTDDADHITVFARHLRTKPTDPVSVRFETFKVVKSSFDPKKIEGGTATIEVDLASLKSGSAERDDDLKSPAFIDVGSFATLTIDVANVKHDTGTTFTADASVTFHGVKKTYPVTFDVIGQTDHSIRIKGEHTFSRLDFGIGTDPATDPQQQVDPALTIELVVTLATT